MATATRMATKRARQREEILVAARALFLREGSAHFTMRKLATKVGCAPGTLYLYFKDKNDLIAVMVEESFERLMGDLERGLPASNPLESVGRIMRAYIEFGLANPNHYYFAFMLRRTPSLEKARPRPHRSYALLLETVRACVEQSLIGRKDIEMAAQGLWSGIHGVTSLMITIPNFPWQDRAGLIDHMVDSLIEGLRPTARPAAKKGRRRQ